MRAPHQRAYFCEALVAVSYGAMTKRDPVLFLT
jgi:hypothetical protein